MTGWPEAALRFAIYADLMLVFGVPAFDLYTARAGDEDAGPIPRRRGTLALLALAGLGLSAAGLAVMAAGMSGVAVGRVDREAIGGVLSATMAGSAWIVRMSALALLLAAVAAAPRALPVVATGTGAAALGSLAFAGHGAMDDGAAGILHLAADVAHLLAAGIWIAALAAFVARLAAPAAAMSEREARDLLRALRRFGTVGVGAVLLIVASGLVNSWLVVGAAQSAALFASRYGRLLLLKLALFAGMLVAAAANRYLLAPALEDALRSGAPGGAVPALRASLLLEGGGALGILVLVAWLGMLEPPISG